MGSTIEPLRPPVQTCNLLKVAFWQIIHANQRLNSLRLHLEISQELHAGRSTSLKSITRHRILLKRNPFMLWQNCWSTEAAGQKFKIQMRALPLWCCSCQILLEYWRFTMDVKVFYIESGPMKTATDGWLQHTPTMCPFQLAEESSNTTAEVPWRSERLVTCPHHGKSWLSTSAMIDDANDQNCRSIP